MLYVILIAIIIVLYRNNQDLKEEKKELEERTSKIKKFCPQCGFDLYKKTVNNTPIQENTFIIEEKESNIINETKPKYTDKEIKNSLILIVGSILVIISALLFLTTTWNITHNFLKTLIIVLMLFIFFTASYIADKILNLKQTSKAFYYIALAYLPILFFSISLFSLFGKYFSIYGLGRYVYFMISSTIVTIIYYEQAKKKESKLLSIASIIFSFCSILFLGFSISSNISFVILTLCLYTTTLGILYQKNIFYLNEEIHKKTLLVIIPSLIVIISYNNIWNMIFSSTKITDIILEIIMLYNIFFIEKNINEYPIFKYIYPVYILSICFNISFLFNLLIIKQIIMIIGMILVYIHDLLRKKDIQIESYIEVLICSIFLYITSLINIVNTNTVLPSYVIMIITAILSFIDYYSKKDETYYFSEKIFSSALMISIIDLIISNHLPIIIIEYISIIFIIYSLLIKNDINLKKSFYWVGNLTFIIISIAGYHYNFSWFIAYILYSFISLYLSTKESNIYRIPGYIYINFAILTLKNELSIEVISIVLSLTTIALILVEQLYKKIDDELNQKYILFQYIASSILLIYLEPSIVCYMLLLLLSISYIYYVKYHKWSDRYMSLPYLFLIPHLYLKEVYILSNINYLYCLSIAFITLFIILTYKKKQNLYIIFFYVYAYLHIQKFTPSHYVSLFIITLGTYIAYRIKTEKTKDIYKATLYTCGMIFIQLIIKDLQLENIISPRYATYLIWIPFITRNIIKKYNEGYKSLEYIGYIIINLAAISNYKSEIDGIIFVCILTIIVICSYLYKIGPIFLVSLIAILVNVLLLTRTFWLSIPWWLYILIIGGVLIVFAIYNEINSKKAKEERITDKIKRNLDL